MSFLIGLTVCCLHLTFTLYSVTQISIKATSHFNSSIYGLKIPILILYQYLKVTLTKQSDYNTQVVADTMSFIIS